KLVPTSSHLFNLILPLTPSDGSTAGPLYTVFLLHPSQPLSHVARLIASSLSPNIPAISFRSASPADPEHSDVEVEWSDSTDIGNFIRSAVTDEHFRIVLTPLKKGHDAVSENARESTEISVSSTNVDQEGDTHPISTTNPDERVITVLVPSFKDRTQFLRRKLHSIDIELKALEKLKLQCDEEAHKGARRMALSGFGGLIVYWVGVARLTFYDYGWDIMEPITYLSGLSTVICGYLWFLYKGREVSYTSVISQSVSTRRAALYRSRGFDMERWSDLLTEQRRIRDEMNRIAEDYDVQWDGSWKLNGNHGTSTGAGADASEPVEVSAETKDKKEREWEKEIIKEQTAKPDAIPRQEVGMGKSEEGAGGDKKRQEDLDRVDKVTPKGGERTK
ncbi:hypothetical protein M422DRAFT_37504, partial [Sphaerobolus stellatus SS14]